MRIMRRFNWIRTACVAALAVAALGLQQSVPAAPTASPAGQLVNTYCVTCHSQKLKSGNLILERVDADHVANAAVVWEKVIVKLRSRAMPPPGLPRPENATYDAVATWLESEIDHAAKPARTQAVRPRCIA